jgi:hypothetical protein
MLPAAVVQVPPDQWHHTPIQLMATAGVRMLRSGSAKMIMAEVSAGQFSLLVWRVKGAASWLGVGG